MVLICERRPLMSGKLPIDRVREAREAPKIYREHSQRLAEQEAELRDADDPVAGARPPAPDTTDDAAGEPTRTDQPKHA
jgi:hypothetical protein